MEVLPDPERPGIPCRWCRGLGRYVHLGDDIGRCIDCKGRGTVSDASCHLCGERITAVSDPFGYTDKAHLHVAMTRMRKAGESVGDARVVRLCVPCGSAFAAGKLSREEPKESFTDWARKILESGVKPIGIFEAALTKLNDADEDSILGEVASAVWTFCCRVELASGVAGLGATEIARRLTDKLRELATKKPG